MTATRHHIGDPTTNKPNQYKVNIEDDVDRRSPLVCNSSDKHKIHIIGE